MRSRWRLRTISTWRLRGTTFRLLKRRISCGPGGRVVSRGEYGRGAEHAGGRGGRVRQRVEREQERGEHRAARGVRGSGASGLVQSTLGTGTNVASFDPAITGSINSEQRYGTAFEYVDLWHAVAAVEHDQRLGNFGYSQAFPTGTSVYGGLQQQSAGEQQPFSILNPTLNANYRVLLQQQLLAGFGFGPNLRYLRIARNNQKISDEALQATGDHDGDADREYVLGPGSGV